MLVSLSQTENYLVGRETSGEALKPKGELSW